MHNTLDGEESFGKLNSFLKLSPLILGRFRNHIQFCGYFALFHMLFQLLPFPWGITQDRNNYLSRIICHCYRKHTQDLIFKLCKSYWTFLSTVMAYNDVTDFNAFFHLFLFLCNHFFSHFFLLPYTKSYTHIHTHTYLL